MLQRNLKKIIAISIVCLPTAVCADSSYVFKEAWRNWHSGIVGTELEGGSEIVTYDSASKNIFVTHSENQRLDVLNPKTGIKQSMIDLSGYGSPNSVASYNGIVAVAVEYSTKTDAGKVVFFDALTGNLQKQIAVGALPDMLTFTSDGSKILVANEGEADNGIDPQGSVSIIDLSNGVANATAATADFSSFNANRAELKANGVRIFDSAASVAQDLEPEYIATADGKAYVTLQENNALAIVDIASNTVTDIVSFGTKDHSIAGNGLDASDKDGAGNIKNYPLKGMYQPDAIASYQVNGQVFLVTANEGDTRNEDERMSKAILDSSVSLIADGRLKISTIDGDTDNDGDIDEPHGFGSRSFSIWDDQGNQVWDSGDALEKLVLEEGTFVEGRSDNKGPEPEGVVLGEVDGKTLAFIGLERSGGVAIYDVTDPKSPEFMDYLANALDVGPEGLTFVSAVDSADGIAFLLVSNEVSGTTTRFNISSVPLPASVWFMISGILGLVWQRKR